MDYISRDDATTIGKELEHSPYLTVKDIRVSKYMPKGTVALVVVDSFQNFEYVLTTKDDVAKVKTEHNAARERHGPKPVGPGGPDTYYSDNSLA